MELMKGFDIVPVLIGLFGIGEVLASLEQRIEQIYSGKLGSVLSMIPRGAEMARGLAASARGTVIGFVLGLLPGMLPALTAYLSYDVERQISRTPEKFGTGMIEGVAAPEAANNATAMAGFIPLLVARHPDHAGAGHPARHADDQRPHARPHAVPAAGPAGVDRDRLDVHRQHRAARAQPAAGRRCGRASAACPITCLRRSCLPSASSAPMRRATPCSTCGWRSPSASSATCMRRLQMPLAPLVLGFLLGPLFEQSLRQSIALQGTPAIFFTRPIPLALIIGAVLVLGVTLWLRPLARGVRTHPRQRERELTASRQKNRYARRKRHAASRDHGAAGRCAGCTARDAHAQAKYPTKPVELIVPFVAGASTDSCARVIAQVLETRWGVPVKVVNKPGGNTVPAVDRGDGGQARRHDHAGRQHRLERDARHRRQEPPLQGVGPHVRRRDGLHAHDVHRPPRLALQDLAARPPRP